jgi:hypothetical protein
MWQLLIPAVTSLLDKIIPDPQAKAEAQLKMLDMAQKGELAALDAEMKLAMGQLEVNKVEAGTDLFRGGWRPLIGYVFGLALAFQYLINPIFMWINVWFATGMEPPDIRLDDTLWELVFGMLGLGGLRTYERVKGKA